MAIQPDTTTGTITLTSGSVNFTTVGTNLITRGHLPGDVIMRNGLVLVIATITGENAGTLRDACPAGAAGSAVPVRIRYQPDGSRVKAEARNLIDLLGNGTLENIANLDGTGGNKIVTMNGPSSFALRTFAQFLSETGAASDSELTAAVDLLVTKAGNGSDFANKRQTLDNLQLQGANIASAATVNLSNATGHFLDITGTVATSAITLTDGSWRLVRAVAAWPIVQGTNLSVNDGTTGTYTCTPGDMILFVADGTVIRGAIFPFDGQPAARVSNNHLSTVATATLKGRVSSGTGDVEDLTQAQTRTFLGMSSFFSGLLGSANGAALYTAMGTVQSTGVNGYIKFPNGMYLQFGQLPASTSNPANGQGTITFPIAFPTACRSVVGSIMVSSADVFTLQIPTISTASFTYRKTYAAAGGYVGAAAGEGIWWMAIGN